jgi:hypothetical protein
MTVLEKQREHRKLQMLADEVFWEDVNCDYCSEEDLRLEAAFRCWLRQLNMCQGAPKSLPDEKELALLAAEYDEQFGQEAWYGWAAWSTCSACSQRECAECASCQQLCRFFTQ